MVKAKKAKKEEKVVQAKRTASPVAKKRKTTTTIKAGWNTMAHLKLKRFTKDDNPKLTPGARRNRKKHPYKALVELDPSGRALCKLQYAVASLWKARFAMYWCWSTTRDIAMLAHCISRVFLESSRNEKSRTYRWNIFQFSGGWRLCWWFQGATW